MCLTSIWHVFKAEDVFNSKINYITKLQFKWFVRVTQEQCEIIFNRWYNTILQVGKKWLLMQSNNSVWVALYSPFFENYNVRPDAIFEDKTIFSACVRL